MYTGAYAASRKLVSGSEKTTEPGSASSRTACTRPGVSVASSGGSGRFHCSSPPATTGVRNAAAAIAAPVSSAGRRRTKPTTSAATAPIAANHAIHAGAGFFKTYSKSPG